MYAWKQKGACSVLYDYQKLFFIVAWRDVYVVVATTTASWIILWNAKDSAFHAKNESVRTKAMASSTMSVYAVINVGNVI